MSRDELEAELFKKFAEQPHWHFVQLQVGTEVDRRMGNAGSAASGAGRYQ
jgi:hypothetical protein